MIPSFKRNPDTTKLVEYMTRRQRVTYEELSAHIGRDVQRDRWILASAIRILATQGIEFVNRRGQGYVRPSNMEMAELSTKVPIRKIRRETRIANRRHPLVNVQDLASDDRVAFDANRSVLYAVQHMTTRGMHTKLAKQVAKQDGGMVGLSAILTVPPKRRTFEERKR